MPEQAAGLDRNLVTAAEVSQLLNVTTVTLCNWRQAKKHLPFYRIGSRVFYDLDEIRNIISLGKVPATGTQEQGVTSEQDHP